MSKPPNPLVSPVYTTICSRLMGFSPPINLAHHIKSDLSVGRSTLEGIGFVAVNTDPLMHALRSAKNRSGNDAFAEGSADDPPNWALQLSYTDPRNRLSRDLVPSRPLTLRRGNWLPSQVEKLCSLVAKTSWNKGCQSCEKKFVAATSSAFAQLLLLPAYTLSPYRSFNRWAV